MKKRRLIIYFAIFLIYSSGLAVAAMPQSTDNYDFSDNEIIIKIRKKSLKPEPQLAFIRDFRNKHHLDKQYHTQLYSMKKTQANLSEDLALLEIPKFKNKAELKKLINQINHEKFKNQDYEIIAAYPNYIYETTSETLNDPYYTKQAVFKVVKPEKTWELSKGKGVVVAVIDTGVDYKHQDLAANIWANSDEIASNGIDDDNNGYVDDIHGWDFIEEAGYNCSWGEDCIGEDNDPMDYSGHGTHVSGIIAATQNNKIGISGIAPEALIMPLRAAYATSPNSASLKTSDILKAIRYAIVNKADVINMSFAGYELGVLEEILDLADDVGIVLVAAAGNNSSDSRVYPAALPKVLAVTAMEYDGEESYYANYGSWIDIAAPGSRILSTTPNNSYDIKQGTSMAAPLVSGLAALILGRNQIRRLSSNEVKKLILANAVESKFEIEKNSSEYFPAMNAEIKFNLEIDSLELPDYLLAGTVLEGEAKASSSDKGIIAYEWTSDKLGRIGSQASLNVDNLPLGTNLISVKAQDSDGNWSSEEYKLIEVVDQEILVPSDLSDKLKFKILRKPHGLKASLAGEAKARAKSYRWISSINGELGSKAFVNLNKLSPGLHLISLSVQDLSGIWTNTLQRIIRIKA